MRHNVYNHGKVHVLSERCETCIFRPGNLMSLNPGRVRDMVESCLSDDGGNIPCHKTLDGQNAICRGFWDGYRDRVPMLQLAERLGAVCEVDPP